MRLALALKDRGQYALVINADSAQVYADLAIVSARPGVDEMQGVEHRLFGYRDGADSCSAADWARDAKAEIADAHRRGAVPILVGGTGLYIRTLLDGIAPVPPIDANVRARIRNLDVATAYAELAEADGHAHARLNPADVTRISRALEVMLSTGKPLHQWQEDKRGGIGAEVALTGLILLPERPWLNARCDARFAQMLARGAEDEIAALLARGLNPDLPVMRAIGVPQIADFLRGHHDEAAMLATGQLATRQYAKRQYTWLRNQSPPEWHRLAFDSSNESIELAIKLLIDGLT